MKRKITISYIALFLLIYLTWSLNVTSALASENQVNWPQGPSVIAESAIVMDAKSGLVLYSKNMDQRLYPASITKIMTTLLALEHSSLSETVTFSHEAVFGIEPGSTHLGINEEEQLTMEQCLYGVMLASANEISSAVAEHVAGSIDEFAKMMTERAKELGCKNTNFVNANGLHNDNHYTSAYDMALIAQEAYKNATFRKIISTKRYTYPPTNKQTESRTFANHHEMLNPDQYPKYSYDYCLGGKTGYTMKAGNTLVTYAKKDEMELICVVMKSKSPKMPQNQYTDTISLLDFGFQNYKQYNLSEESSLALINEKALFTRFNSILNSSTTPIKLSSTPTILIPTTADVNDVIEKIEYNDPVVVGDNKTKIGSITYTYGDKVVGLTDIYYETSTTPQLISNSKFTKQDSSLITNLLDNSSTDSNSWNPFAILGIIIIVILILFVLLRILKKTRRRNRNRKRRYPNRTYYD